MEINNDFNKIKSNDFKRVFLINNNKDKEYYLKEFNSSDECRTWVVNHLDLSKQWNIL